MQSTWRIRLFRKDFSRKRQKIKIIKPPWPITPFETVAYTYTLERTKQTFSKQLYSRSHPQLAKQLSRDFLKLLINKVVSRSVQVQYLNHEFTEKHDKT